MSSTKELCNKSAHLGGFTSLAFFPGTDRKVASAGADSYIKVHRLEAEDGQDPIYEIEHFENVVNAVAVSSDGTMLVAGGEDREVALFKVNKDGEYDFEKLVARSSLDIRDLSFSPASNAVVVATDDKDIQVVNADDPEEVKKLEGHRGGVKAVRFDPKGKFIASTGSDATLRIWDAASGEEVFCLEKAFDQAKANRVTEGNGAPINRCGVSWSHDGLLLAVGGGSDVRVFARDSWDEKESFMGGDASAQISTVEFSRNSCYLLTVNTAGVVLAWDVLSRATTGRRLENAAGNPIQLAVWDPDFNAVAVVGQDGSYGLVGDIIAGDKIGPHEMLDDDEDDDIESFGAAADEEEEGGELILDDPLDVSGSSSSRASKGGGYARSSARYQPEVEAQPAFQPQSTPMEGKRRFMAYTFDGFITCRADSTSNLIEIEFADIERHRPIRFNDYTGYTMAAMGTIGAAFASPITKEGGETVPSQVFYRPFDSWAPNSDWTVNLAKGEEATAIAVGATFVAVATSTRFLRIFSFSGVQLTVVSLMGDAVCMSGHDNMLGVVYHTPASPSLAGDQVLEFQLLDIKTRALLSKGPLCLPPRATLEWFSVLPSSMLACLDSEGYARVFSPSVMGGQWSPVLDIKTVNKARDWFWPIGIDEDHLTGVVCKIEKRYPDVIQPVVSRFDLEVPLCKADASEEKCARKKIFISHDAGKATMDEEDEKDISMRNLELDKGLLQLINAACEQDKLMRALDLAMLIKSDKALVAATTLVKRHNLPMLAERIDMYRQTKIAEEEAAAELAAQAAYQPYGYEEYEEEEEEEENEGSYASRRAPKRPREEADEVESADEGDAGQAQEMDTPPGPPAQRKSSSMFAIKGSGEKTGAVAGSVKFADKMKSIQLKSDAAAAAAKAKPAAFGFGAKKGLGVARGRKAAK